MSFLGEDKDAADKKGKKKKNKNKKKKSKADAESNTLDRIVSKPIAPETKAELSETKADPVDYGEAKREALKKKMAVMTPEEMDAIFGNVEEEDELDEEAEAELAMFSAKLGLGEAPAACHTTGLFR